MFSPLFAVPDEPTRPCCSMVMDEETGVFSEVAIFPVEILTVKF